MKVGLNVQANYNRPQRLALLVGVAATILAVIGFFLNGAAAFFQTYLFSFLFWLAISLGCLGLLLLHFLSGNHWGLAIRRITEAGAGSIWVIAILFLPLLLGMQYIYPWTTATQSSASTMAVKNLYLSVPFFLVRAGIYFVIWMLLALAALRLSNRKSLSREPEDSIRGRMQSLGAAGLILYGLTMTFASIDWLMSIEPFWSSTIFGMLIIIAQVLTAMAFAILVLNLFPGLGLGRAWNYLTTPVPYQDLGAISIVLVLGWAYLAYFQMLIIWAGNLPREVVWYTTRTQGGWQVIIALVAIFQFVIPFILLLSIRVRHNLRLLGWLGLLLLFSNLLNMYWQVIPAFSPGVFSLNWVDLVMPFALGGFWVAAFLFMLQRRPALTLADQRLLNLNPTQEAAPPE